MTAPVHLLALAALVPAAANPALLVRGEALDVTLCGGGSVSIPLENPLPGSNGAACCAKGCHAGEQRKRTRGRIGR